jgi:hypothetical protein
MEKKRNMGGKAQIKNITKILTLEAGILDITATKTRSYFHEARYRQLNAIAVTTPTR